MKRTGTRLALLAVLFAAVLWVLFTINRVPTAPGGQAAAADSIVLASPGYHLTVRRDGSVLVRFPLNEREMTVQEISAQWGWYPAEKAWEHQVTPAEVEQLFTLASRRRLHGVERRYLANGPEGDRYELAVYAGRRAQRRVTFDEASHEEWPLQFTALMGELLRVATPEGQSLPLRTAAP